MVNELISSHQRYKVIKNHKIGSAIAKVVFNPDFTGGVGLPVIIKGVKAWLRKHVFNLLEILRGSRRYGKGPSQLPPATVDPDPCCWRAGGCNS
jgi:hypothetical protein